MKSYEEDKIIFQSLHSSSLCNRAFKQSIIQLSLDTRWQSSFELFSLTGKCYGTEWKSSFEISTEKDRVFTWGVGRLQMSASPHSIQYAWCKRCSQSGPPGGEIHLKFGLWGTIRTPNSVPKFKLAWTPPPPAPGWHGLPPPSSFQWCDTTFQMLQHSLYLHVSFMYREI